MRIVLSLVTLFLISENNNWSPSSIITNIKGVELRNLIFRSKEFIEMELTNAEISAHLSLKGESSFWVITRTDNEFTEHSAIVRVSKDEKSQKVFASLGTFLKDSQGNLVFKIFCKQQLIDYSSKISLLLCRSKE